MKVSTVSTLLLVLVSSMALLSTSQNVTSLEDTTRRTLSLTSSAAGPNYSKTCMITLGTDTTVSNNPDVTGNYPSYRMDVDKAWVKGNGATYLNLYVYGNGFGSANTLTIGAPPNTGGFTFSWGNGVQTVTLTNVLNGYGLYVGTNGGQLTPGVYSIPNGDYTASFRGYITGPELPKGEANELCNPTPTTITFHVHDSSGG